MSKFYDSCWDLWYKRAEKKAMKDPIYAAEELGRKTGRGTSVISGTGSDGKEYTLDGYWEHSKHFSRINPSPWWIKIHHWRDSHRLRVSMKYNDIKWFIQRGKKGYSDYDLWSFDSYLSNVISKALIELRDLSHGHPADLCDDCMQPGEGHECSGFDNWQKILTEISEGFLEDKFNYEGFNQEKFDRAMALFVKHFHSMWD